MSTNGWIAVGTAVLVALVSFRYFFPRRGSFIRDVDLATDSDDYPRGRNYDNLATAQGQMVILIWLGFAALGGGLTYWLLEKGVDGVLKFFS